MAEIGSASLAIIPSFKGFESALDRGASGPLSAAGTSGGVRFGDAAGRSAGRRFGSLFATAAKASLVGIAGVGALAFKVGKDSVSAASDLNESLNAVNVTYGKQARAVKKLGREAADSLGLSNTQFNSLSVRFAAFSKTIAGDKKRKVVGTLDDLTTRAADFASVMNLEVNEAAELFQSGLAGESEPLRKYGLDLSAATVEQYAYAKGIAETGDKLTEAQKIQARYGAIMEQTKKTQGDFANTSDSLANRQRILNARWDDARAKLGQGLLPYMEDLSGWVLNKGLPVFEDFSAWFNSEGIPAIQDFAEDMKPLAESLLPAAGDALGIVRDAAKEAAPYAKALVDAFNAMPKWAKTGALAAPAGLWGLSKIRGGRGGGLAGGLFSKASPVPVFVVNNGVDGAAGGKKGWLKTLATWGGPAAAATAVAGGTTVGINELHKNVAPKTADKGYLTPDSMTGSALASTGFLQGVSKEADKATDALERTAGAGKRLAEEVFGVQAPVEGLGVRIDETGRVTNELKAAIDSIPSPNITYRTSGLLEALSASQRLRSEVYALSGTHDITFRYLVTGQTPAKGGTMVARAAGGYVPGYTDRLLVGERGPEVLSLNSPARVTPNHQLRGGGGGGGGPQRIVLDFGSGRVLSGWMQDEIADADAFAGTRGRMG